MKNSKYQFRNTKESTIARPASATLEVRTAGRAIGRPFRSSQEGGYIVLITVLVLGAISGVIVGILLLTGQNASIASNSVVANTNAKAAASGCAQLALGAIAANTSLTTPVTVNQTLNVVTGQTCSYTITGTSPNFTIATTGTVNQGSKNYAHRLSLTTNQVLPQINVSSWQDSP